MSAELISVGRRPKGYPPEADTLFISGKNKILEFTDTSWPEIGGTQIQEAIFGFG